MRKCLFCPATKLSREHIWPDWIVQEFHARYPSGGHNYKAVRNQPDGTRTERLTTSITAKAKIVCEPCNNEWMSDIETKAIGSLKPLLFTAASPLVLTAEDQCAIALWIGLRTMVFETIVTPTDRYFTEQERSAFARGDVFLPDNTHIWLAPYITSTHRAYFDVLNAHRRTVEGHVVDRMHVMTGFLDQIAFQLWTSTGGFKVDFGRLQSDWGSMVIKLWPSDGADILWPPSTQIGERHRETFRDRLKPKKPS